MFKRTGSHTETFLRETDGLTHPTGSPGFNLTEMEWHGIQHSLRTGEYKPHTVPLYSPLKVEIKPFGMLR